MHNSDTLVLSKGNRKELQAMTNKEIKEYVKAKYQEVEGYIDMIITHTPNDWNEQDIVFKELMGIRTALNFLDKYIDFNGEIDFLQTFIEGEYEKLYK